MRRRLTAITLIIALTSLCFLSPTGALAQSGGSGLTQQVTILVNGVSTTALLTIRSFVNAAGQLLAVGTLTFQDPAGVNRVISVRLPVDIQQSTCLILLLELGPIHLELLGLIIDVSEIVVEITADPEGGLLGDLLCALADTSDLNEIVALLNQILRLL